jgi:hypothetical protein
LSFWARPAASNRSPNDPLNTYSGHPHARTSKAHTPLGLQGYGPQINRFGTAETDCVAEDAVLIGPVWAPKFPSSRKIGIFAVLFP